VLTPTPNAVVLHGIEPADVWEHAPALAKRDGFSLAASTKDLDELLAELRQLP
jgi:putative transcriptional regulator